jgi:ABC-type multidrug transport system ATPase subunit
VTGFLGPNGAGKTTTMRIILGLARSCRSSP